MILMTPLGAIQLVRPSAIVYSLGIWVIMAIAALMNGVFRELFIASIRDDQLVNALWSPSNPLSRPVCSSAQ